MNIFNDIKIIKLFTIFCQKLNNLLNSGMDIKSAIETIYQAEEDKYFKPKIKTLLTEIKSGNTFSKNLNLILPKSASFNLNYSDEVPNISDLLEKLSEYYTNKIKISKKFLSKLAYPIMLVMSVLVILIIFFTVLLPSFKNLYTDLNIPIPQSLSFLWKFSATISSHFISISITTLIVTLLLLPIIIRVMKSIFYSIIFPESESDIFWLLSLLLNSGLNMKQAITCIKFENNPKLMLCFNKFRKDFLSSGEFTSSLCKHFDITVYQKDLLLHSEKSNIIPDSLQAIASEQLSREQNKITFYLSLLQPILLIILSFLIFLFIYFTFIPVLSGIQNIL
jgi:type IV pilus assembly protein PilC